MRGIAGRLRKAGGLTSSLLALVLLVRLLIPAGYMIAPDDAGRPGLVLCVASAAAAAEPAGHSGHDGHSGAPSKSQPGELPCPYAALAAPPLPPEPPALLPPAPLAAAPSGLPPGAGLHRSPLAAPPPPARGPPLSV